MQEFPFASCVPFGTGGALAGGAAERTGVLFRAAGHEAGARRAAGAASRRCWAWPAPTRCATPTPATASAAPRAWCAAAAADEAHLEAFLLAGDTRAEAWIKALLQDQLPAQAFGRQLLRPGADRAGRRGGARQDRLQLLRRRPRRPSRDKLQGCTGNDDAAPRRRCRAR